MKKISVCIPVFNEEENILNTYEKIKKLFNHSLSNYDYEIIFTDNNSSDDTEKIITSLCLDDQKVKYIRFKSNLQYDKSVLEGYKNSTGDAAIVIDCDLQDPPELIINFIEKWEQGHDVVYGVADSRKENFIKKLFRNFFYILMKYNTDFRYPINAHGFRLIDKQVINNLKNINNLFPYVRGLTFSLSKTPIGLTYNRSPRSQGKSKLGVYSSFNYAINAFLEETFLFSKIFRRIALILFFLTIIGTLINFFQAFKFINPFENSVLILLILIYILLSIVCEYVTRIYFQLKKTERIIYEKKINF